MGYRSGRTKRRKIRDFIQHARTAIANLQGDFCATLFAIILQIHHHVASPYRQ